MVDISDLDETSPIDIDLLSVGSGDLRNTKAAIAGSFPTLSAAGGVVNASAAELNYTAGVTSNVQAQLDALPSKLWQLKFADGIDETIDEYTLSPNTKSLLIASAAGQAIFECTIPAISASTDGDTIEVRVAALAQSGRFFQIRTPGFETMRVWIEDMSMWNSNASFINTAADTLFPHVLLIFSGHYNKWVVRYVTGKTDQVS